ncbi:BamA/TamA family outer membrane protein [Halosquirtibacter xylanolyticus]|uniref:BamA/TamA family outer membrane protein n=1 Tax=Halosquirtibacter xylanolyticus TaxID=3374599 RepID=UPI0037480FB0|nr:BamA/TamA family outer membrane protein [Prolixibacteraceae bacterium]
MKRILLLALFAMSLITVLGKDKKQKVPMSERKTRAFDENRFWISPLVAPAYTPELGVSFSAGGLMSFKTDRQDSLIQRSSLPVFIGYTTTGAFIFNARLTSFWNEDKFRVNGDFWFKSMPDNYWGKGYDNGSYFKKSSDITGYDRTWYWINPRFMFRIKKDLYLGANIDLNYTNATNYHSISDAGNTTPFNDGYFNNDQRLNIGLGVILEYDTRDITVNAWQGIYLKTSATAYGSYLGGSSNYQVYDFDYRQYQQIKRKGSVLAWQVRGRFACNDVPWAELSQLGTPFDLRGYTWGQYRDNAMVYGITEYRYTFKKSDGSLSKSGMTIWAAAGTMGESIGDLQNCLPNLGFGYRLELQPRMNFRIDFGVGKETKGLYFNFNEAF